jgi:maltoporin
MKIRQTLVAAAALALLSTGVSAVEFGGYTRVGPGQKQNSGDNRKCFDGRAQDGGAGAPGKGGIGRLGNECETYGEFGLSHTADMGGVTYKALLMTNFYSGGSDVNDDPTVNQIYVEGKGFDIAPAQTFWIGRRFYHRADVHMDDSFYVNMTGTGGGVDGIDTGFGSVSLAAFRTGDGDSDLYAGTRFNLDWEKMPLNPGGTLRLTGTYTRFRGDVLGVTGKNGFGLSVQHIQEGILGGATSTTWLQYARGSTGLDMNFGPATAGSDSKRWRLANSFAWLKGSVTGQTLLHYGNADAPGLDGLGNPVDVTTKVWSIAGRVAYAVTNNFKIQGELGHANNKYNDGSKGDVTKFTIAPTLTVGPNYYDRPELRFYVSYFTYNDTYKAIYGQSKDNKTAVGLQAEIWF